MDSTSYLNPVALRQQFVQAKQNLDAENTAYENLKKDLEEKILNADELQGDTAESLRAYAADYIMILEMLMMANEDDKADAEKLIQELNTEESPLVDTDTVIDGFETLSMLQEAKGKEEMYTRLADEYARAAEECILLRNAYRKTANDYRQRAGIEHEKVEMCQARVDRYDRIEANTKGCFIWTSDPRRLANAALDAMPESFLNGGYQPGMLSDYRSQIRNYLLGKGYTNLYIDTAAWVGSNGKVIEFNCYWVREQQSLLVYGTGECLRFITDLYQNGYVSEKDYRVFCYWNEVINHVPSAEADKIRNMMQESIEHVITTVYIYNCLQVIADRTFTPEECCEANEIFRYFGITDRDSIACFLICCAGESGGFTSIQENYEENDNYSEDESGIGYLQITSEETQKACLEYIHEIYEKGELIENQGVYTGNLIDYPWTASAWYWAIYPKVDVDGGQPLNIYTMERLDDNGGKLTLGVVLTTECFVHGDVDSENNICGGYTIDDALHVIARYDSLRLNDEKDNGGWYVVQNENNNKDCRLYISAEMLEYFENNKNNEIFASDIPSVWDASDYLEFTAPHNWSIFEDSYNELYAAGLIDFDLNTDLP